MGIFTKEMFNDLHKMGALHKLHEYFFKLENNMEIKEITIDKDNKTIAINDGIPHKYIEDPPGPKGVNANDIITPEEMKELEEYLKSNKSY